MPFSGHFLTLSTEVTQTVAQLHQKGLLTLPPVGVWKRETGSKETWRSGRGASAGGSRPSFCLSLLGDGRSLEPLLLLLRNSTSSETIRFVAPDKNSARLYSGNERISATCAAVEPSAVGLIWQEGLPVYRAKRPVAP
jgi:hypothetical protein